MMGMNAAHANYACLFCIIQKTERFKYNMIHFTNISLTQSFQMECFEGSCQKDIGQHGGMSE